MSYVALVQTWPVMNSATSQNLKIAGVIPSIGLQVKATLPEGKECTNACYKVPVKHLLREWFDYIT